MAAKKRGLGKGLEALLGNSGGSFDAGGNVTLEEAATDGLLKNLPVDILQRGVYQPRVDMHPDTLEELANSIRAQGVVQPIVVRPVAGDRYEIIAGERRWRAAQLAGLHEIPAVVRDVPDQAAMAMALIENIQREGLNPMEEATALHRLIEEFGLTHQ
jgi:ParB family transcriptional regulator, chromosome partitioning protein